MMRSTATVLDRVMAAGLTRRKAVAVVLLAFTPPTIAITPRCWHHHETHEHHPEQHDHDDECTICPNARLEMPHTVAPFAIGCGTLDYFIAVVDCYDQFCFQFRPRPCGTRGPPR